MFQACIRTMPTQTGHYTLAFDSKEERAAFCENHPQVYWYFYPEEDDFSPAGWRKGAPWYAPKEPGDEVAQPEDGERW